MHVHVGLPDAVIRKAYEALPSTWPRLCGESDARRHGVELPSTLASALDMPLTLDMKRAELVSYLIQTVTAVLHVVMQNGSEVLSVTADDRAAAAAALPEFMPSQARPAVPKFDYKQLIGRR